MNCPNCGHENPMATKFCTNCGQEVSAYVQPKEKGPADYLLIIFFAILLVTHIISRVIQNFIDDWYEAPYKYILVFVWIISNLSYLLLPFTVKNKTVRAIALVFAIILALMLIIQNLRFLMT